MPDIQYWSTPYTIIVIACIIAGALGILFVLRELFCWYWKLNEVTKLLQEIRDRLPEPPTVEEPRKKLKEIHLTQDGVQA